MSLRGSQILTVAGKYVLDRVQSAGASDVNISRDKIYELGNFESVGTTSGIPELSYDIESLDATAEFEAILIGENPSTFSSTVGSNRIDFRNAVPIDITSPIKSARGAFNVTKGAILPYLTLSKASYSFGVGDSAKQSFTLNGDFVAYVPATPYIEEITNTGTGPYTLANSRTASLYTTTGGAVYVISVCLFDSVTKLYKRLYFDPSGDTGYTNTSTSFTLADDESATYDTIKITYSSDHTENYYSVDQTGVNPNGQQIHLSTTSVKPAAVRSQDLDVYIGSNAATPVWTRFNSVQSVSADWTVSLENDEELGNSRYVASDYDVPEVSGSIGVKPYDPADMWAKLSQITGVTPGEVVGPNASTTVPLEMRINHPDTGARLKTIYVPDARFVVPGMQGQVQSKLENTLNFTSDSGQLFVYNGKRVN